MTICKENLIKKMQLMEQDKNSLNIEVTETPGTARSAKGYDDVWANFIKKIETQRPSVSTSAILETRQYLEDASVKSITILEKRATFFPKLSKLGKRHLCLVATCAKRTYLFYS